MKREMSNASCETTDDVHFTSGVSRLTSCDPFTKLKRRVRDKLNKCNDERKVKMCERILNDTG